MIGSLRDTLKRQFSSKRTLLTPIGDSAEHERAEKKQHAQERREQRRQQRRRREMGKSERDAHNQDAVATSPSSPPHTRHVPALVRSLSKDIDLDEQRRLAEMQDNDQDGDDATDELRKSETDDTDQEFVMKPPVKIHSVGHTTSEGMTGHANEDRVVVHSGEWFHLFAVIDGHGGHKAADFLVDTLFATLEKAYSQSHGFTNKHEIEAAIETLDKMFLAISARDHDDSGACFNALVLYWDKRTQCHQRMVLNCGDCRSIAREASEKMAWNRGKGMRSSRSSWYCNDDRTSTPIISLSEDHSISNRSEKLRVLEAGAILRNRRIAGILEPFRTIGDLDMKGKSMQGWVIPTPEIREDVLQVDRTTFVIATDGVWSVMSNQRAMIIALQELADGGDAQSAAETIADEAREIGSTDDITVIVVSV